jgi:hypothetical protein
MLATQISFSINASRYYSLVNRGRAQSIEVLCLESNIKKLINGDDKKLLFL